MKSACKKCCAATDDDLEQLFMDHGGVDATISYCESQETQPVFPPVDSSKYDDMKSACMECCAATHDDLEQLFMDHGNVEATISYCESQATQPVFPPVTSGKYNAMKSACKKCCAATDDDLEQLFMDHGGVDATISYCESKAK